MSDKTKPRLPDTKWLKEFANTPPVRRSAECGRTTVTQSVSLDLKVYEMLEWGRSQHVKRGRVRDRSEEITSALEVYYAAQGMLPKGRTVVDPILVARVAKLAAEGKQRESE